MVSALRRIVIIYQSLAKVFLIRSHDKYLLPAWKSDKALVRCRPGKQVDHDDAGHDQAHAAERGGVELLALEHPGDRRDRRRRPGPLLAVTVRSADCARSTTGDRTRSRSRARGDEDGSGLLKPSDNLRTSLQRLPQRWRARDRGTSCGLHQQRRSPASSADLMAAA